MAATRGESSPKRGADAEGRPFPLAGVRVIDFTWIVAGPQATRILADLGAEVIRVESEAYLDSLRLAIPDPGAPRSPNRSGLFNNLNRNKRGITLNLHHPGGREIVERLIAAADIVIENYSPGAFERMGLGWKRLCRLNPRIIYLSLSGYGHEGRDCSYVTWGPTAQAVSGLTHLSGLPDQPPAGWGFSYLDHSAGYFGAIALLMALRRRAQGAGAQRIDLSQVETGIAMCGVQMLDWQVNGRSSGRIGNRSSHPELAPHNTYRCAGEDRWIAIAVETDAEWRVLCEVLGARELVADPRFATNSARVASQDALDLAIEVRTRDREAHELMYALQARGVPAGVAQTTQDKMERDEQLSARGYYPSARSPELGWHHFEGLPFQFRRFAWSVRHGAPGLGEHTDEVLRSLGYSDSQLRELREGEAL